MRTRILFLSTLLLLLCFTTCKKESQDDIEEFEVTREVVTPTASSVSIQGTYKYSGKIKAMEVWVADNESFTNANSVPAMLDGTNFHAELGGLTPGTTYHYYYSIDYESNKPYHTAAKTFTTLSASPTVRTLEVMALDSTECRVKCEVLSGGGQEVTERGVCWNILGNPTLDDEALTHSEGGLGIYTLLMENLDMGKKYFVRAYAKNATGVGYGEVLDFETSAQSGTSVDIELICSPEEGGTVSGGGTFEEGTSCTVTAVAAQGYTFVNWTEGGDQVSDLAEYTFTVMGNRVLVANFKAEALEEYNVSVSADPSHGGTVKGGGTYQQGAQCIVSATAKEGYDFINWTENGAQVSTNQNYSFTVTGDRTLVAHFSLSGTVPTGAINGLFSVSSIQQVYFAQGNLQYNASSNTWQFAANQYDYIGNDNSNISQTYNGWIDLFGWGTSGWDCDNVCYHPWDSDNSDGSFYGPPGEYDLTHSYVDSDWGYYNSISNGGNQNHRWRTLTNEEWAYVINFRTTYTSIRYAKARVNNVNGVILLPDNWSSSTYHLNNTNQDIASYNSNIISSSQWLTLENAGAVFLPAAGYRDGTSVLDVGFYGGYWSSSYGYVDYSCSLGFGEDHLFPVFCYYRYFGRSVRLVHLAY